MTTSRNLYRKTFTSLIRTSSINEWLIRWEVTIGISSKRHLFWNLRVNCKSSPNLLQKIRILQFYFREDQETLIVRRRYYTFVQNISPLVSPKLVIPIVTIRCLPRKYFGNSSTTPLIRVSTTENCNMSLESILLNLDCTTFTHDSMIYTDDVWLE